MTNAERALWQELRRRNIPGTRFRRQVPIGPYIADFACLSTRLVIELDGSQHVDRVQYDDKRSAFLEAQHFRMLRFWNALVFTERDAVIETIIWATLHVEWRQERDFAPLVGPSPRTFPLPNPPPSGEGVDGGNAQLLSADMTSPNRSQLSPLKRSSWTDWIG